MSNPALHLHPIQYAIVNGPGFGIGGKIWYNTESTPEAEFSKHLPPGLRSGVSIARFNRCPNCEEYSPCRTRIRILSTLKPEQVLDTV